MDLGRHRHSQLDPRTLLKQPGTVAGLAVVFGLLWVTGWLHRTYFGRIKYVTTTAIAVGATVVVAWAFLALSRKWEAEPSWVDCTGRLIGVAAITIGLLSLTVFGI
jgi:hypothetical protein